MATCSVTEQWPDLSIYIERIGHQVRPDAKFPKDTLTYVNNIILHIASAILQLVNQSEGKITPMIIQTATVAYLSDTGEILKHAIAEGNGAIRRHNSVNEQEKNWTNTSRNS